MKVLHANSRSHIAAATQKLLDQLRWKIFPHSPYSPDLAPSNYHLFLMVKEFLAENVSKVMRRWRIQRPSSLMHLWEKSGSYFRWLMLLNDVTEEEPVFGSLISFQNYPTTPRSFSTRQLLQRIDR
ncbi:hypothetical protein TNCV_4078131 [Trichonephila clavipes]|nr:hypothetical protein TNCV_4078131 [Trichonephila clavipes]